MRPSREVLRSIGRALQLTAGEQRMLQDLRTGEPRKPRALLTEIGEEVEELTGVLEPNPTYVMGARWDLLHWNRAAELLFTNWNRRPAHERNMLWFYLCDPYARRLYVDWETEARTQVAHFRESYSQYGHDSSFMTLLEEISLSPPRRGPGGSGAGRRTAAGSNAYACPTTARSGCGSSVSRSPTTPRSRSSRTSRAGTSSPTTRTTTRTTRRDPDDPDDDGDAHGR